MPSIHSHFIAKSQPSMSPDNRLSSAPRSGAHKIKTAVLAVSVAVALLCGYAPDPFGTVCVLFLSVLIFSVFAGFLAFTNPSFIGILTYGGAVAVLMWLASRSWDPEFTLGRCFGTLGYLFILPALWFAVGKRRWAYEAGLAGARYAFVGLSLYVLAYVARNGFDLSRANIGDFQKNTIGLGLTPLSLCWLFSFKTLKARIAAGVAALLVLVISGSKTAVLVVLVATVGSAFGPGWIFLLSLASLATGYLAAGRLYYIHGFETIYQRKMLMDEALGLVCLSRRTFWFGYGPDRFQSEYQVFGLDKLTSSHNAVLDFWYSFGLIVACAIVVYLGWFLLRCWRRSSPFCIGFCAFMAHSMFDVGWVRGPGFVAAIVMGFAYAEMRHKSLGAGGTFHGGREFISALPRKSAMNLQSVCE